MKQIIIKKIKTKFWCRCYQCKNIFEIAGHIFRGGQGFFCSRKCSDKFRKGKPRKDKVTWGDKISKARIGQFLGDKHWNWKGGKRTESGSGYIIIYSPNHPFPNSGKYVYEHRLVMEKKLNRYLKRTEHIHHINKIRNDNRFKNLKLCLNGESDHMKEHFHKRNKLGRFTK